MKNKFYDDLALSLSQAVSIVKGELKLSRVFIIENNLNRLNTDKKKEKHTDNANIKHRKNCH